MSFNLQNVKFTWDDKFEGKELYASLFVNDLKEIVNRDDNLWKYRITKSDDKSYPFKSENSQYFTFVYYEEEMFEKELTEAKEIISEYIRLSLQEDKDIDANVKLFQKAEAFINKE